MSMKTWVAQCWRIRRCYKLWLWRWWRPAEAAPIRPLAWERLYAVGAALTRKKRKEKSNHVMRNKKMKPLQNRLVSKRRKERLGVPWWLWGLSIWGCHGRGSVSIPGPCRGCGQRTPPTVRSHNASIGTAKRYVLFGRPCDGVSQSHLWAFQGPGRGPQRVSPSHLETHCKQPAQVSEQLYP